MPDIQFHFLQPEQSAGYLLWQITMLWQRKIKRELDKIGITHTQFVLLAALGWLAKEKETVTQIDIANHSKTDRMMVSKVLRTCQKKGWITRAEHLIDTRAKSVVLTKEGEDILQTALYIVEKADQKFFSTLKSQESDFNSQMLVLLKGNE
jgi:DNA-binding MarR family transcriptional regulator